MRRISPLTINKAAPASGKAGFTLIELLIVVAIIAFATFMALPTITSYFQLSLEATAREMAETVKEAYNTTVISGNVHRLAFDLKENEYWVESGPPTALLETEESREREERRKRFSKDENPPPSPFKLEKNITRKKRSLPTGARFEDVITQRIKEPITEGIAYSHFFPHGLGERTLIRFSDESNNRLSIVIAPVLGRCDVYNRHITREEAFDER